MLTALLGCEVGATKGVYSDKLAQDWLQGTDRHWSAALRAEPEQLPAIRQALTAWAERVGMGAEQVEMLALATYEALSNAAEHAYSDTVGMLQVQGDYQPGQGLLQVIVSDQGQWRPEPAERGGLGGRGLVLIRSLTEDADVSTGAMGTTVRMSWTIGRSDSVG